MITNPLPRLWPLARQFLAATPARVAQWTRPLPLAVAVGTAADATWSGPTEFGTQGECGPALRVGFGIEDAVAAWGIDPRADDRHGCLGVEFPQSFDELRDRDGVTRLESTAKLADHYLSLLACGNPHSHRCWSEWYATAPPDATLFTL